MSAWVSVFTVQHVRLGVCETQSAGLQQVCRSDGRSGHRHATQTQHLETAREKSGNGSERRNQKHGAKEEERGEEMYQQRVHRAEVFAGVEVSPQNVLH